MGELSYGILGVLFLDVVVVYMGDLRYGVMVLCGNFDHHTRRPVLRKVLGSRRWFQNIRTVLYVDDTCVDERGNSAV